MSDEVILGKCRSILNQEACIQNFKVSWHDSDDMGIQIVVNTHALNDQESTKTVMHLTKKLRSAIVRGYKLYFRIEYVV